MVRTHRVIELEGTKVILLGNEAVVRGALEAGVGLASAYPGTPSSEIPDTFYAINKALRKKGIYFEYSSNEKCAVEAAAGAAFSGIRSIVSMKHFGMNVASDSVYPLAFFGVKAGMVIVTADDPGCWSSGQSEQDSRWFPRIGHMPMLEPSDPQEAKDFTRFAFELSEKFKIPVFLRLTTRVSHASGVVSLSDLPNIKKKGFFSDENKWNTLPPRLLERHKELHDIMKKIQAWADKSKMNKIFNSASKSDFGIIANGVCFHYVQEALSSLKLKVPILKLAVAWPLPEKKIQNFIKKFKKVLVVEELEPILERAIKRISCDVNHKLKIFGKEVLSYSGEYRTELVENAILRLQGKKPISLDRFNDKILSTVHVERKATFCPGCPHRATFYSVKKVSPSNSVYGGDVGCYVIGVFKPFETQAWLISMGAGPGITHGISKVSGQKCIAFVGDSTFFHGAMPQIVNLVYNNSDTLVIALDNRITAMTGHQPNPSTGINGMGDDSQVLKIEEIVKAMKVKNVGVVNSFNLNQCKTKVKEYLGRKGPSVIVSRGDCRLKFMRNARRQGIKVPVFEIDKDKCSQCGECLYNFGCPAIQREGLKGDFFIDSDLCWGCSVCSQLCPEKAIKVSGGKK